MEFIYIKKTKKKDMGQPRLTHHPQDHGHKIRIAP
jgi:hypothetical protein